MQFEDQAAATETIFNVALDGAYAADAMSTFLMPDQIAQDFLYDPAQYIAEGPLAGTYDIFQKSHGAQRFEEMRWALSGRMVLAAILNGERPMLAPTGLMQEGEGLRVTILQNQATMTTRNEIIAEQSIMIAGVTQADHPSIGQHGAFQNKAEAGHLLSIMGGALQPVIGQKIANGAHVIDQVKTLGGNIVATLSQPDPKNRQAYGILPQPVSSRRLHFDDWPAGLRLLAQRPNSGAVPRLDIPNALPLVQGIGYGALVDSNAVNNAVRLAERMG